MYRGRKNDSENNKSAVEFLLFIVLNWTDPELFFFINQTLSSPVKLTNSPTGGHMLDH